MEVDNSENGSTVTADMASKVPSTDGGGIALKFYDSIVLTAEIFLLLLKVVSQCFVAFYETIFPPVEKDVSREIILVTGTGHGIGRELALQYSALGATLVCADINTVGNEETAQLLRAANEKAKVYTFQCDVSSREAVAELARRVRATVGEVSVLVNNAGIMPCRTFLMHTVDEIRKAFDVNVFAHFWLLQEFLPPMISRNCGHIVAISSMAGAVGFANLVPYCGTKFAVRGIMEALYEEIREDPRKLQVTKMEVNNLKNGSSTVKTEKASKVLPVGRDGIAQKVYDAVVFTADVIHLLLKMIFASFVAFYELICPPAEKDVSEEIILVTGAGHGIGRELALQYSELGATLVCVDINTVGNEETAQLLRAANEKAKVYTFQCDVSSRQAVADLGKRVRATVGEVSVLVNNAGIMPCRPFLEHTEDQIRSTYGVNVFGNCWMLQEFLPSMISRNHGHIVALSSMAGVVGQANVVPYSGTKFAVRGIMEALREEMRRDPRELQIKMTCIYPYIVDTGLGKNLKIRFPKLLEIVTPADSAKQIITSMRRNYNEASVPNSFFYMNKLCRALPSKVPLLLSDFLDTSLQPHDY